MSDFSDELKPADPQGPDILKQERDGSNLNVQQLAQHLLHRDGFLQRQKKILAIIEKRPLFNKRNQLNLARPDRYHLGLARAKELRRLSQEHAWDIEDFKMAEYLVGEVSPYALHTVMFATSIREQCNEEQLKYWKPKVDSWQIIGCYSQTELGHGSNVKGIETEAVWNSSTKDFTIHSPTLTAAKWWNGSLGRTANHAVVIAQLKLPESGKLVSYGPHQFVMQIRDMKTHKPLDGVVIGDIGTKFGYAAMDNGYILFKKFRVPRSSLLARYSGVDQNGKYIRPHNQAIVYGSLTFVRASIIMSTRLVLARACTIAVRYLSIRRQFPDRDSKELQEVAVLNYPTVQVRILPLLATTYALHYTGEAMYELYWKTRAAIEERGDFSRLAELHAASSGLKSCCTILVADGSEECRRALGGHGFGGGSGMIPLNTDHLDKPTVEGDSWMISQQTASYLIKRMEICFKKLDTADCQPIDNQFRYFLEHRAPKTYRMYTDEADLVEVFKYRVSFLSLRAYQNRVEKKQSWTSLMISLHALARAWSECILVDNFYQAVFVQMSDATLGSVTHETMKNLFRLFALSTVDMQSTEFIMSGVLLPEQLHELAPTIQRLMHAIRPHAVPLVDAWSIPDYLLDSALGRSDGDVYNALWKKAHLENPLNLVTFNSDFRSEEIIVGEGAENARKRLQILAEGTCGHEQRDMGLRSKL